MPKKAKELSALEVQRIKIPGLHAVGVVAGLHLQVLPSGARSWVLRVVIGSKRRDMGLGGYPDVTLAGAREKARAAREAIEQGIDPIAVRVAAKSALAAARGTAITFKDAAERFIDAKSGEWRNAKHRQQWTNTLAAYAEPTIGSMQVRDIGLPHIIKILDPIWTTKTETASRVRARLESVLDWATVRGYRHGDNPARWKGHLDKILAKPGKVTKVEHHPALPLDQVAPFMLALRQRHGIAARALEVLILTATRSGEVRGARWDEFDLDAGLWTIPAGRMKANREHRIPLPARVLAILKALPRLVDVELVFPAPRGGILSDMSLTAVTRRMGTAAVPHGFRSTFRDWAAERTDYPGEMAEMALAHTINNKVEAAYRRGNLFEKRRRMMADWARFCEGPAKPAVMAEAPVS